MTFKLSVVKTSDGAYLVNHYYKSEDIRFDNFAQVISQICGYARAPSVFKEEPVLRDLSQEEEQAVEDVRDLALELRIPDRDPYFEYTMKH